MTSPITYAEARRQAFAVSSFAALNEMLLTASPIEADAIHERIAERRAHRAASHRKRAARLRDAAEQKQDRRVHV